MCSRKDGHSATTAAASIPSRSPPPSRPLAKGSHTTARRNVTKVALGAGVDVNLFLTRSLGVAAGVDFGRTAADLMIENGRTAVKFGGFKSRAGVVFKLP